MEANSTAAAAADQRNLTALFSPEAASPPSSVDERLSHQNSSFSSSRQQQIAGNRSDTSSSSSHALDKMMHQPAQTGHEIQLEEELLRSNAVLLSLASVLVLLFVVVLVALILSALAARRKWSKLRRKKWKELEDEEGGFLHQSQEKTSLAHAKEGVDASNMEWTPYEGRAFYGKIVASNPLKDVDFVGARFHNGVPRKRSFEREEENKDKT